MGYTAVTVGPRDLTGPSTRYYAIAEVVAQNQGGNFSTIRLRSVVYNGPVGSTGSFYNDAGATSCSIDSLGISVVHSGHPFLPSGYAQNQLRWDDRIDYNIGHDANGYLGPLTVRLGIAGPANENHYGTLYVDRIPKPPAAPTPLGVGQPTTTTLEYYFSGNDYGGSPITGWEVQYDDDPTFASGTIVGSTGTGVHGPLNPGTKYYFRSRGLNAVGAGPWSSVLSGTTLPAVAPGMTIAPSLNGQSSLVTLSPPGGVSGVTEYNLEWRPSGGSTTALVLTGTTRTITGLTPGAVYEYRANAEIGGYTSPWTAWTPVSQPNPNTNPGRYFDGSSLDTDDLEYVWDDVVNLSRSEALAYGVGGWDAVFNAPSAGMMYRVAGGTVSQYAARVTFTQDTTAAGQWHAGQQLTVDAWSEIASSTIYGFSVFVNPSRTQRMAARAIFYNGSVEVGGTLLGDEVIAPANEWTRLFVVAESPADASRAVVRATDVAGTSYSPFLGGDHVLMDAAMVTLGSNFSPYFDGDTPDTTEYVYNWIGLPFYSESTRALNTSVIVDPLADPDCPPSLAPPTPPVITSDCIEEIGSWRRYMVQVLAADVPLWGATLATMILQTGSVAERQVRIRFYRNPDGLSPDLVDKAEWVSEQIITYIPPDTEITLDGVSQRVWAEVAGADPIPANQLLYGTGGTPAEWPELDCGIGYVATLDVPVEAPAGNLSTRVLLTQKV